MPSDPIKDTAEYPMPPLPSASGPRPVPVVVQAEGAALSHAGLVRPNNEDVYLTVRLGRSYQTLHTNLPTGDVPDLHSVVAYGMLVADGVGGGAAGEVASRMAASTLITLVLDTPDWILLRGVPEEERVRQRAADRCRQIDAALLAAAAADEALTGMGTTMTVAWNLRDALFVVHIGDSRAYLHRDGRLLQLTRDHTYAQHLRDSGLYGPGEEVPAHLRSLLIRALGGRRLSADPEIKQVQLIDGDQVLLCTDGLSDLVDDTSIANVLSVAATPAAACQELIDLALAKGGKDNVTVALNRYHFSSTPPSS